MPSKAVVSSIAFIMIITFLVFTVEFFIPLSAKSDMNIICRNALLKMEIEGGLSIDNRMDLYTKMNECGFLNIGIDGTQRVKQGEKIKLRVEADYIYNKLTGLFTRADITQHMVYDKTAIARKVVN